MTTGGAGATAHAFNPRRSTRRADHLPRAQPQRHEHRPCSCHLSLSGPCVARACALGDPSQLVADAVLTRDEQRASVGRNRQLLLPSTPGGWQKASAAATRSQGRATREGTSGPAFRRQTTILVSESDLAALVRPGGRRRCCGSRGESAVPTSPSAGLSPLRRRPSRPSPDRACTTGRRRGIAHSYIFSFGNSPTRARSCDYSRS